MKRLTGRNTKLGWVNSSILPSYQAIYEKLQEYENSIEDKELIYAKESSKKEIKNKENIFERSNMLTMNFNNEDELEKFLSSHKNLTIFDKRKNEFIDIKTERLEHPKYEEEIVVRFTSNNNEKLIISELEIYKKLSDEAKKIVDCVENVDNTDDFIKIEMGKVFNGVEVTRDLYYEVFEFVTHSGINFWRYPSQLGDIMKIGLDKDDILVMK